VQELSRQVNARFELKTTDRDLKRMGRDDMARQLTEQAEAKIQAIDLSDGAKYLQPDWGAKSVADWARQKFLLKLDPAELVGKDEAEIIDLIRRSVRAIYRHKEETFPVQVAVANFLGDRGPAGGRNYDRAGLYAWARYRFPGLAEGLSEEAFRTESKGKLTELLLDVSKKYMPALDQEAIDARLGDTFEGTEKSEAGDAAELVEWAKSQLKLDVPAEALTGVTEERARQVLWNAYDDKYRPEMRGLERSLLLARLDEAWKKHLLTMDHLRSTVGLRGYAQEDPKTVYKREGMQEFDQMWVGVQDRITDAVFRMEEEEGFQETVGVAIHEAAPRAVAAPVNGDGVSTNGPASDKKPEPIRNTGERVGRNDPCPCGSGKKYKNCHMRQQAGPAGAKR
jgi:preprotein translocase subunit SecA